MVKDLTEGPISDSLAALEIELTFQAAVLTTELPLPFKNTAKWKSKSTLRLHNLTFRYYISYYHRSIQPSFRVPKMCVFFSYKLTFCAESRAGSETGHIHNLHSKLLSCIPVNASAHYTKRPPEKHKHRELRTVGLNGISEKSVNFSAGQQTQLSFCTVQVTVNQSIFMSTETQCNTRKIGSVHETKL